MRICYINYISPSIIHGGAEKVVLEDAKMMADMGNDVFIVSLKHTSDISNIVYLYGGKIRNLFLPLEIHASQSMLSKGFSMFLSFYNGIAVHYLKKLLSMEKPDIVHVHQLGPISLGAIKVAKKLGMKVVMTFHGYYFECPRGALLKRSGKICENPPIYCKLYRSIFHRWLNYCDCIIAISSYVKQRLLKAGYNPNIIRLIPNSVSLKQPKTSEIKPVRPKEILFVGRMVKAKGVHILLKALARIKGIGKEYIINLIGDGEDKNAFESLAKSLSVDVNFIGKISDEDLEQYYDRAWVVVVPSLFPELSPLVPLEAQAHGTPVIASNIGALPDLVLHGQTGFLFTPGNARELASYLETLLINEHLAIEFGKKARLFVKNFSHEKKALQLLKVYNSVLHK